jgi:putative flippase GtrA
MMLRQLLAYGVVGALQLVAEWLLFFLTTAAGTPVPLANVLARVAGASLGFWLNGRYTFSGEAPVLSRRAAGRFAVSWITLTLIGTVVVWWLEHQGGLRLAWLGKPVVDLALAAVGFLASKYWIYTPHPKGQAQRDGAAG